MGETIGTADGKNHWINSDTHFEELIRTYIGQEAAEWYHTRIMSVEDKVKEIRELRGKDYEATPIDQLREIAYIAQEIPGWNEI